MKTDVRDYESDLSEAHRALPQHTKEWLASVARANAKATKIALGRVQAELEKAREEIQAWEDFATSIMEVDKRYKKDPGVGAVYEVKPKRWSEPKTPEPDLSSQEETSTD